MQSISVLEWRFCSAAQKWKEESSMALDIKSEIAPYSASEKDLYEIGEMPPLR
jgi:hypothetical protein